MNDMGAASHFSHHFLLHDFTTSWSLEQATLLLIGWHRGAGLFDNQKI